MLKLTGDNLISESYKRLKNTGDPIGQSVDFSTGFELTVKFTAKYKENSEDYLTVSMNLLSKDGNFFSKYTNYISPVISDSLTVEGTELTCKPTVSLFRLTQDKGYYESNTFDGNTHTLTIRERRVSDKRYIVLHYIDNVLSGSYDLEMTDGAGITLSQGDLPLTNKGNFTILGTDNVRIIDYKYKKLDETKRYFIAFMATTDPTFSSHKIAYKTVDGKVVERSVADLTPNVWGNYLLIQWITLSGQKTSVESWGYWPDRDTDKINVGKYLSPLKSEITEDILQNDRLEGFRSEVTESDYLSSITSRNQWMDAPGIYLFSTRQCIGFAASITSALKTSIYHLPNNIREYKDAGDFVGNYLNYSHGDQYLSLEEMYYPLSNKGITVITPSSVNLSSPINMSTREGAYIGTLKFKSGTVGYGVNFGIGMIITYLGKFGQAKIGDLFNRPDIQAILAMENTPENNRKVAEKEYEYWKSIMNDPKQTFEDRAGGVLGSMFSPDTRVSGQLVASEVRFKLAYTLENYIDPRILNIRNEVEQLKSLALYRLHFLSNILSNKKNKQFSK